jgi:AraC family transcriptional activator of pobA
MQTTELTVCNIGIYGEEVRHFWMDNLISLLEKFPILEFPHKQDFYTFIIIDEADGEIELDNQKIRIDSPKVIIIKPRCITSIKINRKAKGKIISFTEDFFSLRYNNNILNQFSFLQHESKPYFRLNVEQKNRWDIITQLLIDEYILNKRETQKVLRSYINIVLFEIERLYNPQGYVKNKNIRQEKVHEFEMLIDNYFDSKKLPSAYAKLLHVSPNYLNKICKEETNKTAGELIRKRIIIEAQRLLYYTSYTVYEIADKLGFDNTSYFVTFFKNQTRLTPEQYRKNQIT